VSEGRSHKIVRQMRLKCLLAFGLMAVINAALKLDKFKFYKDHEGMLRFYAKLILC
jgi:hypothetical protein